MTDITDKPRRRPPKALLVAVGASFVTALTLPLLVHIPGWLHDRQMEDFEPARYTAPPISEELSGEAREGCLLLGMELEKINADPDSCLREYWTTERLLRSERTWTDWYADNDVLIQCFEPGYVYPPGSDEICELGYALRPALPPLDDPWWNQEVVRDPGRVTDPGPMKYIGLENLTRR